MENIFTDIKHSFKNSSILIQLIMINAVVFILIGLVNVIISLFVPNIPAPVDYIVEYLGLPSNLNRLLYRVWTLITYMFIHQDFLHILFNMLWLYWFGKLFLLSFTPRQLEGLYFIGGLGGAILFILSYNIIPYFILQGDARLIGASAAIMAIVFGIAFYNKNQEIHLLFLGRIKLIYLALFTFILDFLFLTSANGGGHVAHIGGALTGIWFAQRIRLGKDITAPLNGLIDRIINLFKRKPKMKVTYKKNESDYEYNARKNRENAQIDLILDKIKRSGYESLTAEEKRSLFDASKK